MSGARPRSDTEASRSLERRMFEALMLPWVNLVPPTEWMWAMPLAAPREILTLVSQSSGVLPLPLLPVNTSKLSAEENENFKSKLIVPLSFSGS